jgi:hypothetical protein
MGTETQRVTCEIGHRFMAPKDCIWPCACECGRDAAPLEWWFENDSRLRERIAEAFHPRQKASAR